jgi:hypothetical protein
VQPSGAWVTFELERPGNAVKPYRSYDGHRQFSSFRTGDGLNHAPVAKVRRILPLLARHEQAANLRGLVRIERDVNDRARRPRDLFLEEHWDGQMGDTGERPVELFLRGDRKSLLAELHLKPAKAMGTRVGQVDPCGGFQNARKDGAIGHALRMRRIGNREYRTCLDAGGLAPGKSRLSMQLQRVIAEKDNGTETVLHDVDEQPIFIRRRNSTGFGQGPGECDRSISTDRILSNDGTRTRRFRWREKNDGVFRRDETAITGRPAVPRHRITPRAVGLDSRSGINTTAAGIMRAALGPADGWSSA